MTESKLVKLFRVCDVVDAGSSLKGHAEMLSQKYGTVGGASQLCECTTTSNECIESVTLVDE